MDSTTSNDRFDCADDDEHQEGVPAKMLAEMSDDEKLRLVWMMRANDIQPPGDLAAWDPGELRPGEYYYGRGYLSIDGPREFLDPDHRGQNRTFGWIGCGIPDCGCLEPYDPDYPYPEDD